MIRYYLTNNAAKQLLSAANIAGKQLVSVICQILYWPSLSVIKMAGYEPSSFLPVPKLGRRLCP